MSEGIKLELRVFGLPMVLANQVALRFPSRKGLALLILLVLDGTQSRDKLANWLWTDSPNPKDALRNALAQVNKVLSSAGVLPLEATRQSVSWHAAVWLDARQLEQAVSLNILQQFRASWLEGFSLDGAPEFDSWATERGAFYGGLLQQHLQQQIDQTINTGQLENALLLAQQRLRLDVLNESAYRQLMQVQRLAGREAEARGTLLLCQSTLQRELGLSPSALTLAVFEQAMPHPSPATHLIGRNRERHWLEQIQHKNGFALLHGEAGAGKTTLLRSMLPSAQWLECRPNDVALPFSSVLRTLRKNLRQPENWQLPNWARLELARFLPELFEVSHDQPFDRMRLYAAFGLIFTPSTPLVVDDLHFMDEMSAAWLWQLAQQRLDEAAAPTVLTYRPSLLEPETQTALSQLERQGAMTQAILPFDESEVALFLQQLGVHGNLAQEFLRLTGGNVLFLKEAATAYQTSGNLEQGLLPLLKQRLQALTPLEWQLSQFVAVAGSQAILSLASLVLHADQLHLAETWARLEAQDILHGSSFVHSLLRDAVLELTPSTMQKALSASVLDQLELYLRRNEHIAMPILAELAARADDVRRETQYRLEAALEVYGMGFIRAGIGHMERCIQLLEAHPNYLSVAQLERLYFEMLLIYRTDVYSSGSIELTLERLISVARVRQIVSLEAAVIATKADWVAQQNPSLASTLFDQAQELSSHDSRVQYMILELRAWFENRLGDTRLALQYATQSLALTNQDPNLEYRSLEAIYMFEQNLGLWQQAQSHALQAATIAANNTQRRIYRPYSLTMVAFCALQLGDLATAQEKCQTALQLLSDSEGDNALGFAKRTYALTLLEQDDLSRALEFAQQSVQHNQILGNNFALCSSYSAVARVHLAAKRPNAALESLELGESILARIATLGIAPMIQSYLDSLRCHAQTQLGQNALYTALRAIEARSNPSEISSWLLLAPREYELQALVAAKQNKRAKQELETFLALHPDNPRVQILHLRARAVFEPNLLEQARAKAIALGFTMQARLINQSLTGVFQLNNSSTDTTIRQ